MGNHETSERARKSGLTASNAKNADEGSITDFGDGHGSRAGPPTLAKTREREIPEKPFGGWSVVGGAIDPGGNGLTTGSSNNSKKATRSEPGFVC
jgi:hypothetical protein